MTQTTFDIEQKNWTDEVYERLCEAVERATCSGAGSSGAGSSGAGSSGAGSSGAGSSRDGSLDERPVAVFDFDNTCIFHDIGELFSHYLIDEVAYRYDLDAFWELVDPRDGRDHIRGLADTVLAIEPEARRESDAYQEYLAEMGAIYGRKYVREGAASCYEWAVRLHVGMTPDEIRRQTVEAMKREVGRAVEREVRLTRRGERVHIDHGIRIHEEFRCLMPALERAGFDVWVVSATNQWTVETFAELVFDVPADRVLGNKVQMGDAGRLSATTCEPVLYRQGKVDIIAKEIGRRPALVFGDSLTDFEMLCEADELAVLVDCGNDELREKARRRGFAVQPQESLTCSSTWSCP